MHGVRIDFPLKFAVIFSESDNILRRTVDKFIVCGGKRLNGTVVISGAKNASLALMPACILTNGTVRLSNTPVLRDVFTMSSLLTSMGMEISFKDHVLTLNSRAVRRHEAPYEHVKKMRASFYVLGPLIARYGRAKVSLPGGCAWGPRPVNLHIDGMRKLGAHIDVQGGYVVASSKRLKGAKIHFDVSSVGATANVLMAAVLASGTTVIENAAIEPEVTTLAEFLRAMGARIEGIGRNILGIEGVDELHPVDWTTIPDRIEAGTFLVAAAITRGTITLRNVIPEFLSAVSAKLAEAGCTIESGHDSMTIRAPEAITPVDVTTGIYPGFPTDMQAQWIALMSVAQGSSIVTDTIYFDRFKHVPEMVRLGADVEVKDNAAFVRGVHALTGAKVMSTDLRASASLILAGLVASGTTEILRVYHLDRGYESIEEKLQALGADIQRVAGEEF